MRLLFLKLPKPPKLYGFLRRSKYGIKRRFCRPNFFTRVGVQAIPTSALSEVKNLRMPYSVLAATLATLILRKCFEKMRYKFEEDECDSNW